jgi:DnaJ-domain-containing protein 1
MFKSWVSSTVDDAEELFGKPGSRASSGDSDLDAAMDELDDFLNVGRTETEARERDRARREREAEARRAAGGASGSSSYSRSGPPAALLRAYRSLGLAYGAPFPEVKAAYKRLLMQNHPDRNAATPDQLKRSTEISATLNAAYQTIETWQTTGKLDDS